MEDHGSDPSVLSVGPNTEPGHTHAYYNDPVIGMGENIFTETRLALGRKQGGDSSDAFAGSMNNFRYWGRALSAEEVASSFVGSLPLIDPATGLTASGLEVAYSMEISDGKIMNDVEAANPNDDTHITLPGHVTSTDAEVCDDGNTVTETECDYGTQSCVHCNADCTEVLNLTGSYCGDSVLDGDDGEICDDGNTVDETACPYGEESCSLCNADCSATLSLTGPYCGDGIVDVAEGETYDPGEVTASCNALCQTPTGLPPCEEGVEPGSSYEILEDDFGDVGYSSSNLEYLVDPFWEYYWSQNIYPQEHLTEPMYITSISFHVTETSSFNFQNLEIHLKDKGTKRLCPAATRALPSFLMATPKYFRNVTFNSVGWHTITLDTPFTYDVDGRLSVMVVDFEGGATWTTEKVQFQLSSSNRPT